MVLGLLDKSLRRLAHNMGFRCMEGNIFLLAPWHLKQPFERRSPPMVLWFRRMQTVPNLPAIGI